MSATSVFLALSILVEAGSTCPSAAQVQEQIKVRLEENGLRGRLESAEPDRVWVEAGPTEISVELRQPDGTLIGSTKLQVDRNCVELAKAIATQVAAWELALPPSDLGPLPLPSSQTPKPAAAPSPPTRWRLEPGIAVRSLLTGFVPGGSLETTIRRLGWGLGTRLSLNATIPQQNALSTLDTGDVEWTRFNAGLGPIYGWEEGRLFVDVHAEFLLGAVHARGIGWEADWSRTELDPGGGVGIRAGVLWKQFRFWLDSTVAWWPAHHAISVERVAQTMSLDTREAFLSLGTTFLSGW